jgi:hypothetical protein
MIQRRRKRLFGRVALRQVDPQWQQSAAGGGNPRIERRRRCRALYRNDIGPCLGQCGGNAQAQPAAPAGDKCNLAVKSKLIQNHSAPLSARFPWYSAVDSRVISGLSINI